MRISGRFKLRRTQFELDFVDIDTNRDTRLFLDPLFLGSRTDRFSTDAVRTLQNFFEQFISLMQREEIERARELFDHLREPNETCLGLSRGKPRGNGIGDTQAQQIFDSIQHSRAVKSGLLEHLEDVRLFVPNIGKDKVSDLTTNIIRKHLIDYTKQQCALWGIPMQADVPSGFFWDAARSEWVSELSDALIVDGRRILLVPKAIVSHADIYSEGQYHQHHVLTFLQNEHLTMRTVLLQRRHLKNGDVHEFVTKISVEKHEAPLEKEYLAKFTERHAGVFQEFKAQARRKSKSLPNEDIDPKTDLNTVIDHLAETLKGIHPGDEGATLYHRTAAAILELLFYPRLMYPRPEREMNQGRKRIDIVFHNAAPSGFFHRLWNQHNITCPFVFIECKNYTHDVGNPELDQLQGRFDANNGRFGLLICRRASNERKVMERCRDVYIARHDLIIPLYDSDLLAMLEERRLHDDPPAGERLLSDRLQSVALRA